MIFPSESRRHCQDELLAFFSVQTSVSLRYGRRDKSISGRDLEGTARDAVKSGSPLRCNLSTFSMHIDTDMCARYEDPDCPNARESERLQSRRPWNSCPEQAGTVRLNDSPRGGCSTTSDRLVVDLSDQDFREHCQETTPMRDLVNSSDKPNSPFHVCKSTPPRASCFAKARDTLPCLSGAFDCVVNLSPTRKQCRILCGIENLIQFWGDKAHFWTESRGDPQHLDRPTGSNRGRPAISPRLTSDSQRAVIGRRFDSYREPHVLRISNRAIFPAAD
jgi:hypothetical protein